MKKDEVPQDKGALENFTREVYYVKNNSGKYETGLSSGWDVKGAALDQAWEEIERRVKETIQKVEAGDLSPIAYFMELKLMDPAVLAGYSGFSKRKVRRHLKGKHFNKLSEGVLKRYADTFEITIDELKNFSKV